MIFEIIPVKNGFIVQQARSYPSRNPGAALSEGEVWVFPSWGKASEWLASEYAGSDDDGNPL